MRTQRLLLDLRCPRISNTLWIIAFLAAIEDIIFNLSLCQKPTDINADFPCTADTAGRIDLDYSHVYSHPIKLAAHQHVAHRTPRGGSDPVRFPHPKGGGIQFLMIILPSASKS